MPLERPETALGSVAEAEAYQIRGYLSGWVLEFAGWRRDLLSRSSPFAFVLRAVTEAWAALIAIARRSSRVRSLILSIFAPFFPIRLNAWDASQALRVFVMYFFGRFFPVIGRTSPLATVYCSPMDRSTLVTVQSCVWHEH